MNAIVNREKRIRNPLLVIILFSCLAMSIGPVEAQRNNALVEIRAGKNIVKGQILAADDRTVVLLRPTGSMNMIPRNRIDSVVDTGKNFSPSTDHEIRSELMIEFGGDYAVSRSPHFFVVHPHGSYEKWAAPFEELYQRFRNYFSSRGISLAEPEFAMVAVVLNSRQEFDLFLARHSAPDSNVLGFYAPRSNRIITYQPGESASGNSIDLQDLSTIIHEATHQTAYNTGIHSRYAVTPRWASEGLAVMFESRGVNNSAYFGRRAERIHQDQLATLLQADARNDSTLPSVTQLISNDDSFRSDPEYSYALSWGLTFYLAENHPRDYVRYLEQMASVADFEDYSSVQRLNDFADAFGGKIDELEHRMWLFLKKL